MPFKRKRRFSRKRKRVFKRKGMRSFKRARKGPLRVSTPNTVVYAPSPRSFNWLPNTYFTHMRFRSGFEISESITATTITTYAVKANNLLNLLPTATATQGMPGLEEIVLLWRHWYVVSGRVTIDFFPLSSAPDTSALFVALIKRPDTELPADHQEMMQQDRSRSGVVLTSLVKPTRLSLPFNTSKLYGKDTGPVEGFIGEGASASGTAPTKLVHMILAITSSDIADVSINLAGILTVECLVKFTRKEITEPFNAAGLVVNWNAA